ncbi:MAG TPA: uridine kinase [Tessaracoccus flavescens]|uniref:Uridine kinase n=1 Tax=Tessaracoccus flavescens TaxID=399497 RepID=A0A921ELU5_9ACTN|nr:uridine kinase [Tessaracoccus flavescens]
MSRTLLLIAGPSGSGKSRLTRTAVAQGRAVSLSLDDFYHDVDHPGLPMTPMGIPDWDDPATWNLDAAIATVRQLLLEGTAEVPVYDISQSKRVGSRTVDMGAAELLVAEGIFAIQACPAARAAGIDVDALWLDRRPTANFARRLTRDLREKRKTPAVLLRRGVALYRAEPALRKTALSAGFSPVSMRSAMGRVSSGA